MKDGRTAFRRQTGHERSKNATRVRRHIDDIPGKTTTFLVIYRSSSDSDTDLLFPLPTRNMKIWATDRILVKAGGVLPSCFAITSHPLLFHRIRRCQFLWLTVSASACLSGSPCPLLPFLGLMISSHSLPLAIYGRQAQAVLSQGIVLPLGLGATANSSHLV